MCFIPRFCPCFLFGESEIWFTNSDSFKTEFGSKVSHVLNYCGMQRRDHEQNMFTKHPVQYPAKFYPSGAKANDVSGSSVFDGHTRKTVSSKVGPKVYSKWYYR